MSEIIKAQGLSKKYGKTTVLKSQNFTINRGEIIGLIGPNGAGKTTLLKSILGLAPYNGNLEVLGLNPHTHRKALMEQVSFIADTAILPKWLKVKEAIYLVKNIHPKFNTEKALSYLSNTNIPLNASVKTLSKGMLTKLHLTLIMCIDSSLLVLDEPTLGLDIIKSKEFYHQLLGDFFDNDKTIIITTHQIDEIANLITRCMFINNGDIVLDKNTCDIPDSYFELTFEEENLKLIDTLNPIYISKGLSTYTAIFENTPIQNISHLGEIRTPSLSDLFLAKASA